jgi:YaiO family outer membrane protein
MLEIEINLNMKKIFLYPVILFMIFIQQNAYSAETTNNQSTINYENELNKIKKFIKFSDFKNAEELSLKMLAKYPGNQDLSLILANIYTWQKKYNEAIKVYQDILLANYSPEIKNEMDKVITKKALDDVLELKRQIGPEEYKQKLLEFYKTGIDTYNSGYELGMIYFENREYDKAASLFDDLITKFPNEVNFKILFLEALLANKNFSVAKKFYTGLKVNPEEDEEITYIDKNRKDITYRLKNNYFQLKGGYYVYPPNIQNSREFTAELSQQFADFTFIPRITNISRFSLNDSQVGLDVYYPLGNGTRYGLASVTFSPDAEFLPVWTAGAEIFQNIGNYEFSIGYTRMNFKDTGANILKPGVRAYLPFNASIEEKLFFVPEQQAYSLLSTINWEPNYQFNAYYTFGFGQLAEKINSSEDLKKVNSSSHTIGIRYRLIPEVSLNTEFSYIRRENLYEITGASMYTSYWW